MKSIENFFLREIFFSVPPQKPTIIDDKGKEVSSVAGPYEGGEDIKLTCMVSGGEWPVLTIPDYRIAMNYATSIEKKQFTWSTRLLNVQTIGNFD